MLQADPSKVSDRAKKRGLPQLGTLGAGNHYAEIQVVDEIFDKYAASKMGVDFKGQVCIMIHCGNLKFILNHANMLTLEISIFFKRHF